MSTPLTGAGENHAAENISSRENTDRRAYHLFITAFGVNALFRAIFYGCSFSTFLTSAFIAIGVSLFEEYVLLNFIYLRTRNFIQKNDPENKKILSRAEKMIWIMALSLLNTLSYLNFNSFFPSLTMSHTLPFKWTLGIKLAVINLGIDIAFTY